MKTNELKGAALDWAVAKCEGRDKAMEKNRSGMLSFDAGLHPYMADLDKPGRWQVYSPSTDWSQGGPIIERERMHVQPAVGGIWQASLVFGKQLFGPTPLIAAMRCYVASKLGDEVEIPEELEP